MVCVLDAQYKNDSSDAFDLAVVCINYGFTAIFTLELAVNLFAHWLRLFVRRPARLPTPAAPRVPARLPPRPACPPG